MACSTPPELSRILWPQASHARRHALVSSVAMVAECVKSGPVGTGQCWSVPEKGWDDGLTASPGRADLDL